MKITIEQKTDEKFYRVFVALRVLDASIHHEGFAVDGGELAVLENRVMNLVRDTASLQSRLAEYRQLKGKT